MDKKLKARWLKALRGGKYKQARKHYFNPKTNGYCCLGVLACLNSGVRGKSMHSDGIIRSAEVTIGSDSLVEELIAMNDFKKKSFKQIANFIEAKL